MAVRIALSLVVASILIGILSVWIASLSTPATPTPENVASKWTGENSGILNDEMSEFILAQTGGGGENVIGYQVRDRIADVVVWEYVVSPVDPDAGSYDVTAKASVLFESVSVPLADGDSFDGYIEMDMAYHLLVNLDEETVTDWHAHFDEAVFDTNIPTLVGSSSELIQTLGLEPPRADCLMAAIDAGIPEYAMSTLRKPLSKHEPGESIQLGAALNAYGIMDDCKPYLENAAR